MAAREDRGSDNLDSGSAMATLAYLSLGAIAWGTHFALLYGVQAMVCATAGANDTARAVIDAVIVAATVLALAILAAAVVWRQPILHRLGAATWSETTVRFVRSTHALLVMLGAWGILAAAATRTVLPACAVLR